MTQLPENFEKNIIAVLLGALVPLMLLAALCRHLWPDLHRYPLAASAGCLAWIGALGMARAAYLGTHARMSVLEYVVSERARRRLAVFSDILFFVFALLAFVIGVGVFFVAATHSAPTAHPVICLAVPVGGLLTMIRLVQRLRERGGGAA